MSLQNKPLILLFTTLSLLAFASPIERQPFHIFTAEKYPGSAFNDMTSVQVSLGEQYYINHELGTPGNRPLNTMLLFLFTNATALDSSYSKYFEALVSTQDFPLDYEPYGSDVLYAMGSITAWSGKRLNYPHLTIGNSSNPTWQLSTSAMYDIGTTTLENINTLTTDHIRDLRDYITNKNTYGFIGLGIGGQASKNFKGDHPLFSIQVKDSGAGSLIFGKDDTLYNSERPSFSFPTDTNWTMMTQSVTFGSSISFESYSTRLVFDLNHPGISLPYRYFYGSSNTFDKLFEKLNIKLNSTDKTYAIGDSYRLTYYGNITDLPDLTFGLTNNLILTIPPQAYARRSTADNNTWVLLLTFSGPLACRYEMEGNYYSSYEYTILGLPFLASYYTVFEQINGETPTVTLHPTYEDPNAKSEIPPVTPEEPVTPPKPEEPKEPSKPEEPIAEPTKPTEPVDPKTDNMDTPKSSGGRYWYYLVIAGVIGVVAWKVHARRAAKKLELDLESENGNNQNRLL